jgi:hypothetical protein
MASAEEDARWYSKRAGFTRAVRKFRPWEESSQRGEATLTRFGAQPYDVVFPHHLDRERGPQVKLGERRGTLAAGAQPTP